MNTVPLRFFLKTAALGVLAGSSIVRAAAPQQKVRVACVGVGGMGRTAVQAASDEEIVAICDVDWRERKSEDCAFEIAAEHPAVPRFTDFREMLDKKGNAIDGMRGRGHIEIRDKGPEHQPLRRRATAGKWVQDANGPPCPA